MADKTQEKAGLISRNQGGGQAPLGDTRMEIDTETGRLIHKPGFVGKADVNLQSPGLPRSRGTDATQWGSWRQIQALELDDQKTLHLMKKEIFKMMSATKHQKNISMVVKDGLALMVELYDSLNANLRKKSSLRDVLKTEVEQATRWSPRKESKGTTRKRIRGEEQNDSSTISGSESEFTDSTFYPQATIGSSSSYAANIGDQGVSTKSEGNPKKKGEPKKKKEKTTKQEERALQIIKEHKTKKRKSRNRRRPEALVIKVSDSLSYSEVLKSLREKMKHGDTGTEIRSIRKTMKGDVLLELEGTAEISKEFREAVEGAVGNSQVVTGLAPRASVEIRDLDDLTTEAEVKQALEARLQGKGGDITVFLTKSNSRSQRMAIVEMAEKGVDIIMETAKVRIGCVNCRVRRRVEVFRCFKCIGYGHRARECRGTDRTNMCFKCGSNGHKGAACTGTAKCVLCMELGADATHIPGRRGCSAFGQALERAKKKLK